MARLKVFQTTSGFFETVVAAPSQKAALEAWGVRQNLFGEGMASVTEDAKAVSAALAHPGVVLRRAVGSKGAFELDASEPPTLPKAVKGGKQITPKPDRGPLDAAQRAIDALERERTAKLQELADRRQALDDEEDAAERDYRQGRTQLGQRLDAARTAYRRAGGKV